MRRAISLVFLVALTIFCFPWWGDSIEINKQIANVRKCWSKGRILKGWIEMSSRELPCEKTERYEDWLRKTFQLGVVTAVPNTASISLGEEFFISKDLVVFCPKHGVFPDSGIEKIPNNLSWENAYLSRPGNPQLSKLFFVLVFFSSVFLFIFKPLQKVQFSIMLFCLFSSYVLFSNCSQISIIDPLPKINYAFQFLGVIYLLSAFWPSPKNDKAGKGF